MRYVVRLGLAVMLALSVAIPVAAAPVPSRSFASPVILLRQSTNEAFVFGTVACDATEPATVTAVVTQGTVSRAGTTTVSCGPRQRVWLIRLPDDGTGTFTSGPADLEWGFSAGTGVFGRFVPAFIVGF